MLRRDDIDLREFFSSPEAQVSNLTLTIFHLPFNKIFVLYSVHTMC